MKYRIKELRGARGWTQQHLADLAGTSKGYISQLESGDRSPSAETLRALASAFRVDASQMIAPSSDEARDIMHHLEVFQRLSAEDRATIARLAEKLLPNDEP